VFDYLDNVLRHLLGTRISGFSEAQVGFIPPDRDWRNQLSQLNQPMLNVYLVELRENRKLRSNDVVQKLVGGVWIETPAPSRVDAHYLISAWSPVTGSPLLEPSIDEQVLLYQAADVLFSASPLDANAVYAPGSLPAAFPDALLDPCPPTSVAPPEGFPRLADFWLRMDWVWKPVVELVVTIPVVAVDRVAGPPVTTLTPRFGQVDRADSIETRIAIGGVIRLAGQPVPGGWVRIVETGTMVTANDAGQFIFDIAAGSYTLEGGARGHIAVSRPIVVPSLSGEYDLNLA
jgi:hypothetical protein